MSKNLPSVFIGSSSEGIDVAREVELQLQYDVITTIWKDGVFGLGSGILESLMNIIDQFDFAVMILSADDLLETRSQNYASPRDNVIFELGLFMGRLGRSRVFIVHEHDVNLKLPSDLAGITASPFRKRDNLSAALSPTCTPIIKAIRALGFYEQRTQQQLRQLEGRQESLESKVQLLTSQISLKGIVTKFELDKLHGLTCNSSFQVHYHPRMYDELHHLDAMQFVTPTEGHGLVDIKNKYEKRKDIEFDLKEYVEITKEGCDYLRILTQLMRPSSPEKE